MRFQRKEKSRPRVFLGTLAVVPREDIKWVLEDMFGDPGSEIEGFLHDQLEEIFALPQASTADPVLESDLCIDVYIPGFHSGSADMLQVTHWHVPLFWRPKIELRARLYRLHDRKLIKTFMVTEKPTLREFWSAALSWRSVFGSGEAFDEKDLAYLLNRGAVRLLQKIVKVAYA